MEFKLVSWKSLNEFDFPYKKLCVKEVIYERKSFGIIKLKIGLLKKEKYSSWLHENSNLSPKSKILTTKYCYSMLVVGE